MPLEVLNIYTCDKCGRSPEEDEAIDKGNSDPFGWARIEIHIWNNASEEGFEEFPEKYICPGCWPEVKKALEN